LGLDSTIHIVGEIYAIVINPLYHIFWRRTRTTCTPIHVRTTMDKLVAVAEIKFRIAQESIDTNIRILMNCSFHYNMFNLYTRIQNLFFLIHIYIDIF
ncbi:hypothetical protein ACJX0J_006476, partial [Zea mays]